MYISNVCEYLSDMDNIENILSSFEVQDQLYPKIWYLPNEKHMGDPEGQKYKINPKVRKNLLEITYQFIESLDIDVVIEDIIVVGSIANYNWSKFSDIDVHILVDYKQFSNELKDMYVEYFDLKKVIKKEM
jgi:predicted nucleotidyltransferase